MSDLSTLKKGLEILFLFSKNHNGMNVSEIASELELPKSTVYKYISTLKSKGLINENAKSGYYQLGFKILELAQAARKMLKISDIALPMMQRLQTETEETVLLLSIQNRKVYCIEAVESNHTLRFSSKQGRAMCMHVGASSKIMMAYLDEEEQERIIREEGLYEFTENTITDPYQLKEDLKNIRKNGYAVTTGELDLGVRGIAAPILGKNEVLKAGLSISGPVERITDSKVAKFVPLVIKTANDIAKLINKAGVSFEHKY